VPSDPPDLRCLNTKRQADMAVDEKDIAHPGDVKAGSSGDEEGRAAAPDNSSLIDAEEFAYSEDRRIGITGAVFLILNKMIGTGSTSIGQHTLTLHGS
jgi:hypothetical protein